MTTVVEPALLSPRYYLENFLRLCETVVSQYGDVLTEREKRFLQVFGQASTDARCLFVRLVSRRGPLFRAAELHYPELDDLDAAVQENLESGLLQQIEEPPVPELLALLRRAELLRIYREPLCLSGRERKADLVDALLGLPPQQLISIWRAGRDPADRLIAVSFQAEVDLFQLLFFGNTHQTLTEFVLSDLGIVNFESYALDSSFRMFANRDEIDEYRALCELKLCFKQAVAELDEAAVGEVATWLANSTVNPRLHTVRDALANRVARQLERQGDHAQALALYAVSERHPARQRRVRLLCAANRDREALALCETMAREPWNEPEADFVRRQLPVLRRKLQLGHPPVRRDRFDRESLVLEREMPVELAAARHYAQRWEEVHYVENMLINGSFGLAFWEQIFAPVAGAFINPFQAAPMDMFSRDFYRSRREAIDRRLVALGDCDLQRELLGAYEKHQGINNRWVSWRGLSPELLCNALALVPRQHWLAFWQRILFDPEANRNGCPDLVALDPKRGYCLIEVKGPGDQLQLNQRRWLRFFQREGVPARIAQVSWRDD